MFSYSQLRGTTPMSDEQIRKVAPAAFAEAPHDSRSDRYLYIPTCEIIEGMRKEGFFVSQATQSSSRSADGAATAKHMIRFRHADDSDVSAAKVGDSVPEVVLINSHDGSCSYQLSAGLFRLICLNGLMVGEKASGITVPHREHAVRDVIEGSYQVITGARKSLETVGAMQELALSDDERLLLAGQAHQLRFGDSAQGPLIAVDQLLDTRRREDRGNHLWRTFNTIQENVVRGGLRAFDTNTRTRRGRSRVVRTREVKGIDQSTALNRALWALAEGMKHLKEGGAIEDLLQAA